MNTALGRQNNGEKNIRVGIVLDTAIAIDHTPIHTFVITAKLQHGDEIEWDEAKKILIYKRNNLGSA